MISREEARRQLEEMHSGYLTTLLEEQNRLGREAVLLADCEALCMAIEALSQPERPKGQWIGEIIYTEGEEEHAMQKCSVCGKLRIVDNFCSNCSADMRGEEE